MCRDFKIDAFIKIWIMVCMIEYWIVCKAMLMFGIEMYTGTSYVGWLPIITWFWWAFKDAVWYSNNSMSFQTPWITIIPKHAAVVNEFQVLCIYTVTSAWTTRAYQLKSMEPNLKQLFLNLKQGATVGASIGCRVPHQSKTQVRSTSTKVMRSDKTQYSCAKCMTKGHSASQN